jgi:hypothetical protein
MSRTRKTVGPKERFDHLLSVISSQRFLSKQGLGNEVPFFICPYPAEEAVAMEAMRASLVNQLGNRGVRAFEINLYDVGFAPSRLYRRGSPTSESRHRGYRPYALDRSLVRAIVSLSLAGSVSSPS